MRYLYSQFLRWAFTRFYREFAWAYDAVATLVSRGLWQHWIVAVVPFLRGEQVLELGSGTGYLQRALLVAQMPSVGLDISRQMVRRASRRVARVSGTPRLLQGCAQHLPLAAEFFSDVVATFPSEYILEQATLREAWRVLQPGGQIVLLDAAQLTTQDAYNTAIEAAYRVTQQVRTGDTRSQLLRTAGFAVREQWVGVRNSRVQLLIGTKPAASAAIATHSSGAR